jgi:hypothetical protein
MDGSWRPPLRRPHRDAGIDVRRPLDQASQLGCVQCVFRLNSRALAKDTATLTRIVGQYHDPIAACAEPICHVAMNWYWRLAEVLRLDHAQHGSKTFRVHLDGFNLMPFFKGEMQENPRPGFLYWSDEGELMALRYGNWKIHFIEQRAEGLNAWQEPFVTLRWPKLFKPAERSLRERGRCR